MREDSMIERLSGFFRNAFADKTKYLSFFNSRLRPETTFMTLLPELNDIARSLMSGVA